MNAHLASSEPLAAAPVWDLHVPPGHGTDPDWLTEVESFRARVLFDGGLRPSFRAEDGSYLDVDPVDRSAHHVTASGGGVVVGSFRALPLTAGGVGLCEQLLGEGGVDRLLATIGCAPEEAWEGGGWVVDQERQGTGLGARLLAAGVAAAESLGLRVMIGAAGVRYGQYRKLARAGYRRVPGFAMVPVDRFADDLCMVYAVTRATSGSFRCLVAQAGADLGLRDQPTPGSQA